MVSNFEPKLKMQKLVHPEVSAEDQHKLVLHELPGDDRLPFLLAISRRNYSTWIEKREAELQLALERWVSIVDTWPSTWRCKQELDGCISVENHWN